MCLLELARKHEPILKRFFDLFVNTILAFPCEIMLLKRSDNLQNYPLSETSRIVTVSQDRYDHRKSEKFL